MNSVGTVDPGTLGWLKDEIDQTLERARDALRDFARQDDDLTAIRMYANHLHQVVGTLQMVELDGAAALALESELLADAVVQGVEDRDLESVTELLDASVTHLSLYLDRLQRGLRNTPLSNLDLINTLRGARGEPAVDEYSLFYPDLEVYPTPEPRGQKVDLDESKTRAREIRRRFQLVLLEWLRDGAPERLRVIAGLATELQRLARFGSVSQLWWVANAFALMLGGEDLSPDDARKHIFGRLDQILRRLVEGGEPLVVKEGARDLVSRMLYDIGRSDSRLDAVDEIRRAFDLDNLLQGDADIFRADLTPDVLAELYTDLAETLRGIDSEVSEYFDSAQADPETLGRVTAALGVVAARAHDRGFDELAELAQQAAGVSREVGELLIAKEAAALPLAEALLFTGETLRRKTLDAEWKIQLDNQLEQLRKLRSGGDEGIEVVEVGDADRSLSDADVKQLTAAVAEEVQVSLKNAEELLEAFAKDFGDVTTLEPMVRCLSQVQGAFQMLGHHRAADMLAMAGSYTNGLLRRELEPNSALIDALAVSIGAGQMFVEGLRGDKPFIHEMVDRAIHDLEDALAERDLVFLDPDAAMESLGMALEDWLADSADYQAFRLARSHLRDISALTHRRGQAKAWQIAQEMSNLLDIVSEDPSFLSAEIEDTLRRSLDTLGEYKAALITPPADIEPGREASGDHDDLDQEILEIFKEEARECITNIEGLFEDWRSDALDERTSMELRRQFHTLKGSGRTANAGAAAELAWIIENLLNHVIDKRVDVSEDLRVFMIDAKNAISDLVERGLPGESEFDLRRWDNRASAILDAGAGPGDAVDVPADAAPELENATDTGPETGMKSADVIDVIPRVGARDTTEAGIAQGRTDAESAETDAGIDDTVVRIFTQETLGHLKTIREFVDAVTDEPKPAQGMTELRRAIHTLRGTSRSLHLVEMSNVFGALDDFLNKIGAQNALLSADDVSIFEESTVLSAKALDTLNRDRTFPATLREEFDELQRKIETRELKPGLDDEDPDSDALGTRIGLLEDLISTDLALDISDAGPTDVDEFSLEVRDIFCEEAFDLLQRINSQLTQWRDGAPASVSIEPLLRDLHTLKGSARAAGVNAVGDLSHNTETLLEYAKDEPEIDSVALNTLLEEVHDALFKMVREAEQHDTPREEEGLTQRVLYFHQRTQGDESETPGEPAPEAREPDVLQPEAGEPEVEQPEAEEPEVEEPEVEEPEVEEPEVEEPEVEEPEVEEPEVEEPEVEEPEVEEPEVEEPEVEEPEVEEPEAQEPEAQEPEAQEPEAEEPEAEEPKAEEPKAEEPKAEEPKAEEPEAEEPEAEEPEAEEPKVEEPEVEEPEVQSVPVRAPEVQLPAGGPGVGPADGITDAIEVAAEAAVGSAVTDAPPMDAEKVLRVESTPTGPAPASVRTPNAEGDSGRNMFRVKAQVLDKLVNYAGEVSISRAQMQEQLSDLSANLSELRGNVGRFGDQLRELDIQADSQIRARTTEPERDDDFDPLELDRYTRLQQLSRSLSESLDDLVTIQGGLTQFANKTETTLQQQAHMSTELQEGLLSTRLIPFSNLVPRLRYQTRQTARELGKQAELQVTGGEVEVDRKVLDNMAESLDHMIRNALGHGIESPAEREAQGKTPVGAIKIVCKQEGNEIVLHFGDDGRGLDVAAIKQRAVAAGLLQPDAEVSDQEIMQLIVTPGFSTSTQVTKLYGRGVGMDVVDNSVRSLGGSIALEDGAGGGAAFIIRLPISLSITQALFVRCGAQVFAISLGVIQSVLKVDAADIRRPADDGQILLEREGQVYPLMDLTRSLNLESVRGQDERVPVLLVRMGARVVAVQVDEFLGTQEVVVKPLGSHLGVVPGIGGATIRGDGSIVIILDLAELWLARRQRTIAADSTRRSVAAGTADSRVIMVVDDSLTVRKVTARNLTRNGMETMLAKDGVDALEQIRLKRPDLMLVDIEMPRMDGYELTERIRESAATRNIPIVIITSRAGAKHKERAMKLGADAYLTKPYQEADLMKEVTECLARAAERAPA